MSTRPRVTFDERGFCSACRWEDRPLGTAGSLYYLKNKIKDHFFLTNCDTIVNTNYFNILNFHLKNKNDITVVVAKKIFNLPYGVCNVEKKNFQFILPI